MADIFISYKSEERALPEALASDLRAAGYSVWWDVDLVGGAAFRAQILEKLNAARAVIVIWTPASVQSEFVLDEADHAKREGKLIPVRLPELDPRHIPLGHRQAQTCLLSERPRILGALQAMGLSTQPATRAGALVRRDPGRRTVEAGGKRGKIAGSRRAARFAKTRAMALVQSGRGQLCRDRRDLFGDAKGAGVHRRGLGACAKDRADRHLARLRSGLQRQPLRRSGGRGNCPPR